MSENNRKCHFSVIAGEISEITIVEGDVGLVGRLRQSSDTLTDKDIEAIGQQIKRLPYGQIPNTWPPTKQPRVVIIDHIKWAMAGGISYDKETTIEEILDRLHLTKAMPKDRVFLRSLVHVPTFTNFEAFLNGFSKGNDSHRELTEYLAQYTRKQPAHWLSVASYSRRW